MTTGARPRPITVQVGVEAVIVFHTIGSDLHLLLRGRPFLACCLQALGVEVRDAGKNTWELLANLAACVLHATSTHGKCDFHGGAVFCVQQLGRLPLHSLRHEMLAIKSSLA